ncbi:MAG: DUF1549 domain-containing protein, partial [Acidobacteriota bacterium]
MRIRSRLPKKYAARLFLVFLPLITCHLNAQSSLTGIFFEPKSVFFWGTGQTQILALTGSYADGSLRDVTNMAKFSTPSPSIASIAGGRLTSRGYGTGRVYAVLGGHRASALVVVRQSGRARTLNFAIDVAPIFSRVGCNTSGCHGALNGQAGFKLSLFGYDPDSDFEAVVKNAEGRRVNLKDPGESLILQKPTFAISHGGGQLIEKDSLEYKALYDWIAAGAPQGTPGGPRLEQLAVYPGGQRFITSSDQKQQLVVVGKYSDGREVDMTHQVRYTPADETVVSVSSEGLVTPKRNGETSIMIRSLGAVGVAHVAVVVRPPVAKSQGSKTENFIDTIVSEKLRRLRIEPSETSSDSEFVRRVFLDLIGTLPTADEARNFLADRSADKRARLIDGLFERREYADFWSLKWGDLLTNSPQFLFNGTAYFQAWLREAFATNKPYDRMVRELLVSTGGTYQARPSNFYAVGKKPEDLATFASQAFLGVSLECARCHDHPSEKWKREDFLGLAAFFSQVRFKGGARNNERFLYIDPDKEFLHPQTKQVVAARFLGGAAVDFQPQEDRRARLADWMTSPSNPYFARAIV